MRGAGGQGDIGMLRLDLPGYSGERKLEEIGWDEFFEKFDERGLALIHQEETAQGRKSRFSRIVSRDSVGEREEPQEKPKTRTAR